mmetsp:Transcript_1230/g.4944  ORF Transcript_1230/g.4944 Transcript_1230/m.4944 type:complete len:232 (+) Transcript_1230:1251-1946(+)
MYRTPHRSPYACVSTVTRCPRFSKRCASEYMCSSTPPRLGRKKSETIRMDSRRDDFPNVSTSPFPPVPSAPLHQPSPRAGPGRHRRESANASASERRFFSVSVSSRTDSSRAANIAACARRYASRATGKPGRIFENTNTTRRPSRLPWPSLLFSSSPSPVVSRGPRSSRATFPTVVVSSGSAEAGKTRKHRYERTSLARTASSTAAERSRWTSMNRTPRCFLSPPKRSTVS